MYDFYIIFFKIILIKRFLINRFDLIKFIHEKFYRYRIRRIHRLTESHLFASKRSREEPREWCIYKNEKNREKNKEERSSTAMTSEARIAIMVDTNSGKV